MGDVVFDVQPQLLDALFTGILPLGVPMLTLFLLKNKKMKSTTVMGILILIGLVGGITGILG
jgi:PTS system mannose-specific IID component